MSNELFYLQDSRSGGTVGNDILFWKKDWKGYTTNVNEAHVFTRDQAIAQHRSRETDIPWPKEYIDARVRPACDFQYCNREEALAAAGIELVKPQREPKLVDRCEGCGRFEKRDARYSRDCPNCGTDNRP